MGASPHSPGLSKEFFRFAKCNEILRSQFDLFHRLLIPLLQFFIQGDVLVDGQSFPTRMTRDQLKLGIGKARIAGQPRYALVAEGMGHGPNITRGRIRRMQRMRDLGFKVKVIADPVGVSYATVIRHTSKR